ncbi:unnamed protein product, partial [Polarella glacialis]
MLLDAGLHPDEKLGRDGQTALMCAAEGGQLETAKLLMQRGADPDVSTAAGTTALMLAAAAGHIKLVEHFVEHGADLEAVDARGRTAMLAAVESRRWSSVRALLALGANGEAEDKSGAKLELLAAGELRSNVEGMNSGPQVPQVAGAAANRLSLEDPEHLSRQVAELFFKHVEVPRPFHLEQTGVGRQVLPKPGRNVSYERHLVQLASIVGNMERRGLLKPSITGDGRLQEDAKVILEFGAGRGMLTLALQAVLTGALGILVERRIVSKRSDRALRAAGLAHGLNLAQDLSSKSSFSRLTIDIRDLDLSRAIASFGVSPGRAVGRPVLAVSKHLCGAATDLALRCLKASHAAESNNSSSSNNSNKITNNNNSNSSNNNHSSSSRNNNNNNSNNDSEAAASGCVTQGVAVALCCHHLCNWQDYTGQRYFQETLGLTPGDFEVLRRASRWSVANLPMSRARLSLEALRETGLRCKLLLDMGRVEFLRQELQMEAELVEYCEPAASPENVLLLGWRK